MNDPNRRTDHSDGNSEIPRLSERDDLNPNADPGAVGRDRSGTDSLSVADDRGLENSRLADDSESNDARRAQEESGPDDISRGSRASSDEDFDDFGGTGRGDR